MGRLCHWLLISSLAVLLSSCTSHDFDRDEYNYRGPQQAAVVVIQEPQVFERASLINDRRQELEHLEQLLVDSKGVRFTPSILRNLDIFRQLGLSLEAGQNQLASDAAKRAGDEADLASDLKIKQLQTSLELEKARLEMAKAGTLETDSESQTTVNVNPVNADLTETATSIETLNKSVEEIKSSLAELKKSVDEKDTVNRPTDPTMAGDNNAPIKSSPLEHFRDIQAYRNELRQALEETRLDDAHDINGGTIYRLQFHATVFPGKNPDKWALSKLNIGVVDHLGYDMDSATHEGSVQGQEVNGTSRQKHEQRNHHYKRLYRDWLNYLNDSLNGRDHITDALSHKRSAQYRYNLATLTELGKSSGMFEVKMLRVSSPESCPKGVDMRKDANDRQDRENPDRVEKPRLPYVGEFDVPVVVPPERNWVLEGRLKSIAHLTQGLTPCTSTVVGTWVETGRPHHHPSDSNDSSCPGVPKHPACTDSARSSGKLQPPGANFADYGTAPENFISIVARASKPKIYAVGPTERNQQVATVANISSALDLAVGYQQAVTGSIPLTVNAGLNLIDQATSRMEALERIPELVSFSSVEQSGEPYFGWAFGPRARIGGQGKKLEFFHVPRPHRVYADIVVPAWIDTIKIETRSAWIADWQEGSLLENPSTQERLRSRTLTAELPGGNSAMEAMTNAIAEAVSVNAALKPLIWRVDPQKVLSCASSVTLAIYGSNLWRDTQVLMEGVPAKSVKIIPGMAGVLAEFPLKDLFKNGNLMPAMNQTAHIEVFTRHGRDYYSIDIDNGVGDKSCAIPKPAQGDGALKLKASQTRLVKNQPIKLLATSGKLPGGYSDIRLMVRKKGSGLTYVDQANKIIVSYEDTTVNPVTINAPTKTSGSTFADGDVLEATLQTTSKPGAQPSQTIISGDLVFYNTKPKIAVSTTSTDISAFPVTVLLSLPKSYSNAYPTASWDIKEVKLAGVLTDVPSSTAMNLTVKPVTGKWPIGSGTHNGKFAVTIELADQAAKNHWTSLNINDKATLELKYPGAIDPPTFTPLQNLVKK